MNSYTMVSFLGICATIIYRLLKFNISMADGKDKEADSLRWPNLPSRLDHLKTQAISAAVRFLEYQGMIVSCVRWDGANLVIFMDKIDLNEAIEIEEQELISWPA